MKFEKKIIICNNKEVSKKVLLLKIFKEGWLFSCRCFSRGPPFKCIIQLKRNKISVKNLITTATKVSEENKETITKIKKQVIKVGC